MSINDQFYLKVNNNSENERSSNRSKSSCIRRRPLPIFIFIPYFMYFLSIFLSSALIQQLIIDVACHKLINDDCSDASVSKLSSRIFFYSSLCTQIPCFFMSGILGSLADRYGRKLILTISSSGLLGYLLGIIYIAYYEPDDYILILLLSSSLYGFCGGFQGFQLGCYSYLADVTNNRVKYRTLYYSILESFLILSKVVGPSSAGYYASKKGFFPPLALAGLMSILVIINVNIIPESLPQDEQQPFIMEPLKSFQNIKLFFTLKTVKGKNPLPILAVAFGIFFTAYFGYLNVYVLYLKHVFDSSTETIGYYASTESIICVFSMLLLPIIVQKLLGNIIKSIYWVVIGYISQSIFFFLFAAVTSEKEIFLCLIMLCLTGPIIPMTRAIMVNSVAPHLQTTILAGFSAVQSTSQLLCPVIIIIYSDNGNPPTFFT